MTKKGFIALADVLAKGPFGLEQIRILADFCQKRNPRFDRDKWLTYIEKGDK